ncbi:MAG: DUF481 domain-containing protein [Bdellovibrionota bacterium]
MRYFLLLLVFISLPAMAGGWKNEDEVGVIVSTGNSRTQSLSAKQTTDYEWSSNSWHFKSSFLQSKNQGILNARRWDVGLRYEREFSHFWRAFTGETVESDPFAGYQQRYGTDIGAKYWIYREEKKFEWFTELGYRYQIENRTNGTQARDSLVRTYTEAERNWNPTASSKIWVEYLPNLSTGKAWQLNGEASSSFALYNAFSVKLAYLVKYNNSPTNAKKTDTTYTTGLLAKF